MNLVTVSLSSGEPFTKHQPLKLTYVMAFRAIADFIIYDVGLYTTLALKPTDEIIFDIQTTVGKAVRFVGILYKMESLGKAGSYRLHIVSKYFRGLMSTEPLYGKGFISDIIGSFYAKANVPRIDKDASDVSVDNIVFPSSTRTDDAILFLLDRATAANDSYLVGTVVGDSAYVRDIKKGKEIRGYYYDPIKVIDGRKKVDILGGLKMSVASDAEELATQTSTGVGDNKVKVDRFYGITDAALASAYVKVQQRHIYYQGYIAHVAAVGWEPLLGSRIIVDKDAIDDSSWYEKMLRGQYFVNSHILTIEFSRAVSKSHLGMQLVG